MLSDFTFHSREPFFRKPITSSTDLLRSTASAEQSPRNQYTAEDIAKLLITEPVPVAPTACYKQNREA